MISSTVSEISYNGNNSTGTAYPAPFPLSDPSHLKASITDSDGDTTPLSYPTDYSVSVYRDSNGRITSAAVTTTAAVPVTSTVRLYRDTPALQSLDLIETGTISAETLESALDAQTMAIIDAARNATQGGTSNVDAAGTGLVVQTAANTFAARSLVAGDGIAITNPDGVAAAPTITADNSGLNTVTTADLSTLARIGDDNITLENLASLLRPPFGQVNIPASEIVPASTGGCTVATIGTGQTRVSASFSTTGTQTGYVYFTAPDDLGSGEITVRLRTYTPSVTGGAVQFDFAAARAVNDQLGSIPAIQESVTRTPFSGGFFEFALPVSPTPGEEVALMIQRNYSGNAADTYNAAFSVFSVEIQYPTRRAPGWV